LKSDLRPPNPNPSGTNAARGFEKVFLRLVKSGPERRAIEAGQVDAVLDPASGTAVLLPEAQRALIGRKARFRHLAGLASDWFWEQDEFYRLVSHTGTASGSSGIFDESIIGKTLWDLPFVSMGEADWQAHRRLLEWRAAVRDLELRCTDRAGEVRWVSINGEPTFDERDQFKGYRGTMRDITLRKQSEALAQKPLRLACDTLDALAVQVCVLDAAGTVIIANKPAGAFAAGSRSIGAVVREGVNYLEVCDKARGSERVDGVAIAAGIRQVIAGDSPLFHHEYVCNAPARRCRFNLTVTAFSGDGAARVVVARENVTERKRVERVPGDGATRAVVSRGNVAGHLSAEGEPVANSLLAALPRKDYRRLRAGLEPVALTYGEVLYEPGDPIQHVYFPNNCVVSLLETLEEHEALEVGLVGREGMVGIPLALGTDVSSVRALVQGSGTAMRMESAHFLKAFKQCLPLQRELYRYANTKLSQARQSAACNRFHGVEARLARWLLMTRDRMGMDDFRLTHELLGSMLGVLRGAVTKAAGALQQRKLISYSRGNIRILDGNGLEAAACRCYQIAGSIHS